MNSIFEYEDILLRPFHSGDLNGLRSYLNHPDVVGCRYLPWGYPETAPLSDPQIEEIIEKWGREKKGLHLAVTSQTTGELIGHCGCDWEWDTHSPNLWVVIAPEQRRRGSGRGALDLLLGYIFKQTPAHCVSCWVAGWNQAAIDFLHSAGFQTCGGMRRAGIHEGKTFDLVITDLLRREWQDGENHAS